MLPALHYQGLDAAQHFGYQPASDSAASPMMHPTRMAALAVANDVMQSAQVGMVWSAGGMEGAPDDVPPAKRQNFARLPGGQLYSEDDWVLLHPVRWHLRCTIFF
jgi:splicing factor 3A subunit 1